MRKDSILQQYYYKKLPNYQNAGSVIYVSDPHDPRLKSYNDSLFNFNIGERLNAVLDKSKRHFRVKPGSILDTRIQKAASSNSGGLKDNSDKADRRIKAIMNEYQRFGNKSIKPVRYQGFHEDPDNAVTDLVTLRFLRSRVGLTDSDDIEGNYNIPNWRKPVVRYEFTDGPRPSAVTRTSTVSRTPARTPTPVKKKPKPVSPPIQKKQEKPTEVKTQVPEVKQVETSKPSVPAINYNQGIPVYAPTPYGGGTPGAFIGFKDKSGKITYVQPEDYERMGVPNYGKEYIKRMQVQEYGGLTKYQNAGQAPYPIPRSSYKPANIYGERMQENIPAAIDFWKKWYTGRKTIPEFADVSERRLQLLEQPYDITYNDPNQMLVDNAAGSYMPRSRRFEFVDPNVPFNPDYFNEKQKKEFNEDQYKSIMASGTGLPVLGHEWFHKLQYEAPEGKTNTLVRYPFRRKGETFAPYRDVKLGKQGYNYLSQMGFVGGGKHFEKVNKYNKAPYPANRSTYFHPEMEAGVAMLRISENMDPTKTYTPEDVTEMIKKYSQYSGKKPDANTPIEEMERVHSGSYISSMFDMLGNDPVKIAKYLNSVAGVQSQKQPDTAKMGGQMMQKGGGKKRGNPISNWWYNLDDVQGTYKMYNDLDPFLKNWYQNPETQRRLKQNLEESLLHRSTNPNQLISNTINTLQNTPVFSRELVNKAGISANDLEHNNELQGWKSPSTIFGNPYFDNYNYLTRTSEQGSYSPITKQIIVNSFNLPGTVAHEGVHAARELQEAMEDVIDRKYFSKKNLDARFAEQLGSSKYEGGKRIPELFEQVKEKYPGIYSYWKEQDEYLNKDGMYPRIMDIRRTLNLKPGQKVDKSILTNESILGPLSDLEKYYDDDTIIEMLNTLAKNEGPRQQDRAAYGGPLYNYYRGKMTGPSIFQPGGQYKSLKNDKAWFDSHAKWSDTGNPEWDERARQLILTGRFGINPATNELIKLPKNEWTNVSEGYKQRSSAEWSKTPVESRFNSKTPAGEETRKDWVANSMQEVFRNPITYAPAAIAAAPFVAGAVASSAPIVGAALNTPMLGVAGATPANLAASYFAADALVNRLPQVPGQVRRGKYTDAAVNALTGALDLTGANMLSRITKLVKSSPSITSNASRKVGWDSEDFRLPLTQDDVFTLHNYGKANEALNLGNKKSVKHYDELNMKLADLENKLGQDWRYSADDVKKYNELLNKYNALSDNLQQSYRADINPFVLSELQKLNPTRPLFYNMPEQHIQSLVGADDFKAYVNPYVNSHSQILNENLEGLRNFLQSNKYRQMKRMIPPNQLGGDISLPNVYPNQMISRFDIGGASRCPEGQRYDAVLGKCVYINMEAYITPIDGPRGYTPEQKRMQLGMEPSSSSNEPLAVGTTTSDLFLKKWYAGRVNDPRYGKVAQKRIAEVPKIKETPTTAEDLKKQNATAYYILGTKNIYIDPKNPYSRGASTQTHEKTHELYDQVPQPRQDQIIRSLIIPEQNWKNSSNNSGKYSYYSDPTEVAARLNQFRKRYGIDPSKKYTKEEMKDIIHAHRNRYSSPVNIEQLRTDDQSGDTNIDQLLDIIGDDPDKLAQLNDLIVMNQVIDPTRAMYGGLVSRYQPGGVVKDDTGYWNPNNWGEVVEINSPDITMEGVYEPLLGVSDTGDTKYMEPGKNYKFKGSKVREYPVNLNLPKYEKPPKGFFTGYTFNESPDPNVNIVGVGGYGEYSPNSRLTLTGSASSPSVFYPGGNQLFMKPNFEAGLRYRFDDGGTPPMPGYDWLKSWVSHPAAKERLAKMGRKNPEAEQSRMLGLLSEYQPKTYKDLLKDQGFGAWWGKIGSSDGVSYGDPLTIYVKKGNKTNDPNVESIRAHELTHLLENNGRWLTKSENEMLTKPLVKNPTFLQRLFGTRNMDYYTDPTEVHARMNEARKYFNMTPDQEFTPEMFDEIKKKKKWFGMKKYIKDKKGFIDLMNTFVSNEQPRNMDMARVGGGINKYYYNKGYGVPQFKEGGQMDDLQKYYLGRIRTQRW